MSLWVGSSSIAQVYLGNIKIGKIYIGNTLVFDGMQWTWCLTSLDGLFLQSSDGFKLRPKMEA